LDKEKADETAAKAMAARMSQKSLVSPLPILAWAGTRQKSSFRKSMIP